MKGDHIGRRRSPRAVALEEEEEEEEGKEVKEEKEE